MMKTLLVGAVIVGAVMLSGCAADDPLGATTRAKDHNQAWITTNQADENAKIAAANADSMARITVSNNDLAARTKEADTRLAVTQAQENGQSNRAGIWSTMIATTAFVLCLGLIIMIAVHYGGKIALLKTRYNLQAHQLMLLQDYADRTGKQIVMRNGQYFLTDGVTTIRAILKD